MTTPRDPRLGYGDQFPALTLGGHAYQRPASTRLIGGGYFVVLDMFPAPGFDADAAITELLNGLRGTRKRTPG